MSVGFVRQEDQPSEIDTGAITIVRAELCELSLVVEPSVPGAEVMAVRGVQRRRTPSLLEDVDDVLAERGIRRTR